MDADYCERLRASAVQFLVDGHEEDAASVLLQCRLEIEESGDTWFVGDETHRALHIKVTGPRAAYETLSNSDHDVTRAITGAIKALLPADTYIKHFTPHAEILEIDPHWSRENLEIVRGRGVRNQASFAQNARVWRDLRFRSESEKVIAQALDRAGVLFLPNCVARLGGPEGRMNKEPDFLVCHNGKWGILEVDGEPFHPPVRTAQDHERDRVFKQHGVRVVEHFDAGECYKSPDAVVEKFLKLLSQP